MKKTIIALAASGALLFACGAKEEKTENMNPFFEAYDTPFEVPPFDKIKNEHFSPAILEGIKQQQAEINAIVNNTEDPTFANTIEAMEKSGELLVKASAVFSNFNSANTNDTLQAIAKELAPEISKHSDNISLNEKLFAKVKTIWENKDNLGLNGEQQKLLEKTYKSFVRNGANLNEADKEKLRNINSKLSVWSLTFGQNLLAETNAFKLFVDNEADLAGLPQELKDAAKADAKAAGEESKWLFTLQNPSIMPFLQYAENRELRKQIWDAYQSRANKDNDKDAFEKCVASLDLADQIEAKCCVNIAGSRDAEIWAGPHQENFSDDTFDIIVETTRKIIDEVKPKNTFYTLEAMPWIFPESADAYLRLIKAIDRKAFAVHLDPVNMVVSPAVFFRNGDLIKDCFKKLGPHIKSCHAKDLILKKQTFMPQFDEVQPGLGQMDYGVFLSELSKFPEVPLMMEHLQTAEQYKSGAEYIWKVEQELS